MKVEMRSSMVLVDAKTGKKTNYGKGDIVDIDDANGQRMIAKGLAVEIEKPKRRTRKKAQPEAPAVPRRVDE